MVTGFRYAPGWEYYGVTPDMTTLAKILAEGLLEAAVATSREILSLFDIRDDDPQWTRFRRIKPPRHVQRQPLSAAPAWPAWRSSGTQRAEAGLGDRRPDQGRDERRPAPARGGGHAGGDVSLVNLSLKTPGGKNKGFSHLLRSAMQLGVDFSGG